MVKILPLISRNEISQISLMILFKNYPPEGFIEQKHQYMVVVIIK